jgi:hypothetical protein
MSRQGYSRAHYQRVSNAGSGNPPATDAEKCAVWREMATRHADRSDVVEMCAALIREHGGELEHITQIETEVRGEDIGIGKELHLYHRWSCSCGAGGPWGRSLWAKTSISSAEKAAQRHVLNVRDMETR